MNVLEKFWSELPPEVFLQLHSQAGFSEAQLKVVVGKAVKAGMLAAAEIANNMPTCYSGQVRDGADIAANEIKAKADEL